MTAFYTFRLIRSVPEPVIDVSKWETNDSRPEAVYRVYPKTNSCSCVATKRDCRHVKMVLSLIDPEFIGEMYRWKWDSKNGFTEMNDMPIQEFVDAVLAH